MEITQFCTANRKYHLTKFMIASPTQMLQTLPSSTYPFCSAKPFTSLIKFSLSSSLWTIMFYSFYRCWGPWCCGSSPFTIPMQNSPDQLLFQGSQCITGYGIFTNFSIFSPVSSSTSLLAFYSQFSSYSSPEGNSRTKLLTGGLKLAINTIQLLPDLYFMTGITSTPSMLRPLFLVVVLYTVSQLGTTFSPIEYAMYLSPSQFPSNAIYSPTTLLSIFSFMLLFVLYLQLTNICQ